MTSELQISAELLGAALGDVFVSATIADEEVVGYYQPHKRLVKVPRRINIYKLIALIKTYANKFSLCIDSNTHHGKGNAKLCKYSGEVCYEIYNQESEVSAVIICGEWIATNFKKDGVAQYED